jgi:hypothetical protein
LTLKTLRARLLGRWTCRRAIEWARTEGVAPVVLADVMKIVSAARAIAASLAENAAPKLSDERTGGRNGIMQRQPV